MFARLALMAALVLAGPVVALELALPGNATLTREVVTSPGSYRAPVGPFADGSVPVQEVSGTVTAQAWRIEAQGMTTLQIMAPLRAQLATAGYEILFDCAGVACGGFDFRFGIRVLPAPDMFVDLRDYRFLAARGPEGAEEPGYVTLLVSAVGASGYVQVIQAGLGVAVSDGIAVTSQAPAVLPMVEGPLAEVLVAHGHVVLWDLTFETGSAALGNGSFESLEALARFLLADPERRVALVGHTDAVGRLDRNIALSKRRAASVLERLVERFGVPRGQMEAEGMGYLSPVAPNTTEEGREANRRVEAVLLNTE